MQPTARDPRAGAHFHTIRATRTVRTQTIRFLDYWLGVPACALLTAVRRLQRERRGTPQRILFLKFIEQGATVLAQDAIRRATARVGRDNIFFCVFESNRAILDVLGVVPAANIITIRDRQSRDLPDRFPARAARRCARDGVDTVIDMEFFSRASAIFAFLSGASTRVGPASLYRRAAVPRRPDDASGPVQPAPARLAAVRRARRGRVPRPGRRAAAQGAVAQIADGDTAAPRFICADSRRTSPHTR